MSTRRIEVGPEPGEPPREWAETVLAIVLKHDPDASVVLDGDEWVVETRLPAQGLLGVRLVPPAWMDF